MITSLVDPVGFCQQVAELPRKGRLAVYSREAAAWQMKLRNELSNAPNVNVVPISYGFFTSGRISLRSFLANPTFVSPDAFRASISRPWNA